MLELWSWMFSFDLFDDFLSFLSNLTKGTAFFFANQTAFLLFKRRLFVNQS